MSYRDSDDDNLAYGHYNPNHSDRETERGIISDSFERLRDSYRHSQSPRPPPSQGSPEYGSMYHGQTSKSDRLSSLLGKIQGAAVDIGSQLADRMGAALDPQAYAEYGQGKPSNTGTATRFGSFAPPRSGTDVKWYVDGCSYFYAVSQALENAKESVWILDWWLSPELYLRRPPAKNEQYRLDRMLQSAAQRGVRINIIVYKEVPQALPLSSYHTKHHLEDLHSNIAVFRHPDHVPDRHEFESSIAESFQNLSLSENTLAQLSEDTTKALYGIEDDTIFYWSHHEKLCLIDGRIAFMGGLDLCFGRWDTNQHAIADNHPADSSDIVFPGQDYNNARVMDFQDVARWENNSLDRKVTSRMGWSDISVSLFGPAVEDLRRHFVERWNFIFDAKYKDRKNPRYRKLLLYGRQNSSTGNSSPLPQGSSHTAALRLPYPPSASSQPAHAVAHISAGGQDTSLCQPPTTSYNIQPTVPGIHGYTHTEGTFLPPPSNSSQSDYTASIQYHDQGQDPVTSFASFPGQNAQNAVSFNGPNQNSISTTPLSDPAPIQVLPLTQGAQLQQTRAAEIYSEGQLHEEIYPERGLKLDPCSFREDFRGYGNALRGQLAGQIHQYQERLASYGSSAQPQGNMTCQILRSCCKWSHGVPTEHSIADAYEAVIRNSEHFVYIENQFFITATGDAQHPVKNKIGAAVVERILRAARAGEKYKIIVVIPSVPCFAGDLADESSLGTRAIMEFQYNSISRGGHSIMELIAKEGYNPMDYIRFYNLRNYDRINVCSLATYEEEQANDIGRVSRQDAPDAKVHLKPYQHSSSTKSFAPGRWDSVSECYMLNGEDVRNVPWGGPSEAEVDAFVSEELYIHSKVMIADDRVVICGSANLNDRSQLGNHDSEIAVVIEDHTPIQSSMNGKPWTASRFGASLRRELFRKHLGLLPPQNSQRWEPGFGPVGSPISFDFDTPESQIVADPLSDTFESLWNTRARTNTDVFHKVFHSVPDDIVRDWATYREFHGYYFHADKDTEGKQSGQPSRYGWGHVVRDNFPSGAEGARQVKELLSQVKGSLVEMPLMFLIGEDIAKEGLKLNHWTEPLYT